MLESGSTTRSADECEMSRSCQSATLSSPTMLFARTTRAIPQMRSERIGLRLWGDRKSTRLNSSHSQISYAVFCLKKKKQNHEFAFFNQTLTGQLELMPCRMPS